MTSTLTDDRAGAHPPHTAVEIIRMKRDGHRLTHAQIDWFVDAYARGIVADEQMSALAMAIYLNGMTRPEITGWTQAMIASGDRMNFASMSPTVDKHSTGGVGDKITLPLVPLVAACGVRVPQMCGRGLGHTGGTLDKLESIPGWRGDLTEAELRHVLNRVGGVICSATGNMVPADKKLYALRDATSTVESIPLISSSIMSKKIAEGTGSLVLDVKVGSGAFMKTVEQGHELARTLVDIGNDAGVRTVALLTDMSTPLGLTVGNALEVREAIEVLEGGGPSDVVELTLALAREMLTSVGRTDIDPAQVLTSGRAMDTWRSLITAQGGDLTASLPVARHTDHVAADSDGILTEIDAYDVAQASWLLGAGRARKEDAVDLTAGVQLHAKRGDFVRKGQPLMTLHANDSGRFPRARESAEHAVQIGSQAPIGQSIVLGRVD